MRSLLPACSLLLATACAGPVEQEAGPCGHFSRLGQAGGAAVYEYTGGSAGGFTYTPAGTDVYQGEDVFVAETSGWSQAEGLDDYSWDDRTLYRCDDEGVWVRQSSSVSSYTIDGTRHEVSSTTVYDQLMLVVRNDMVIGERWSNTAEFTTTIDDVSTTTTWSRDFQVVSKETVEVAAGSYDVYVVETTDENGTDEVWWARGIGFIGDSAMELVSFSE